MITFDSKKETVTDLFQSNSKTSDWYFYNASTKAKGFNEFKRKWGTRTNTDNWRRKNAVPVIKNENNAAQLNTNPDDVDAAATNAAADTNDKKAKNNKNELTESGTIEVAT
jgi:hypothetical protein